MQNFELLQLIKNTTLEIVEREMKPSPDELARLKQQFDEKLTVDAPLAELGWDSVRMTWLLVRLEERLAIDTSTLSLYELFTVGDLLQQLQLRLAAK